MGRGRQKAKHTKVARELKYYSPDTDLSALQAELSGHGTTRTEVATQDSSWEAPEEEDDEWSSYTRQ